MRRSNGRLGFVTGTDGKDLLAPLFYSPMSIARRGKGCNRPSSGNVAFGEAACTSDGEIGRCPGGRRCVEI